MLHRLKMERNRWDVWFGPILTVAMFVFMMVLVGAGVPVRTPGVLFSVAVVYSGYRGGGLSAGVSAFLAILFSAYIHRGHQGSSLGEVVGITIALTLLAIMVGILQKRLRRLAYDEGRARLQHERDERLHAELERRVQERTEALKAAIEARDRFLVQAAHELRTPLTSLRLQLEMTKRATRNLDLVPRDQLANALRIASRQLDRLTELTEDLLDVSRIQVGKLILRLEEVDLSAAMTEIVSRFSRQLGEPAGCPVSAVIEPGIVGVFDVSRLEQVLANLFSNAVKYAPDMPMEIRLERAGEIVRLSVTDHGPGVAQENQSRIFERFERPSAGRGMSGLGLGLFLVREIAIAHGGTVHVESEQGHGASFIVELPLRTALRAVDVRAG